MPFFSLFSARIGTSHVLVVYELSPSTRTTDLERVFEKYKDGGVVIRWVNDTVALAVFRTPALGKLRIYFSLVHRAHGAIIVS